MIVFREADHRYPFLWEDSNQQAGRWHADGEGPVQYFSDTPDGAWAEFLRHEEIKDAKDLAGIKRAIWAVEIPDNEEYAIPNLKDKSLLGNQNTYTDCQAEARKMKKKTIGILAPSAALKRGGARGWRVDNGLQKGKDRDGKVIVLFGKRPNLVGWLVTKEGKPSKDLLELVRHF